MSDIGDSAANMVERIDVELDNARKALAAVQVLIGRDLHWEVNNLIDANEVLFEKCEEHKRAIASLRQQLEDRRHVSADVGAHSEDQIAYERFSRVKDMEKDLKIIVLRDCLRWYADRRKWFGEPANLFGKDEDGFAQAEVCLRTFGMLDDAKVTR
jgi:hypothetical protein